MGYGGEVTTFTIDLRKEPVSNAMKKLKELLKQDWCHAFELEVRVTPK